MLLFYNSMFGSIGMDSVILITGVGISGITAKAR